MKKLIITLFALSVMSVVSSASLTKEQTESLNEKIKGYDYVGSFSGNRALVIKDNKAGFINKSGDVVIPLQYENIAYKRRYFRNGLWCDESVGVIDSMGNRLVPEGKVKRILQVPQEPFRGINKFPEYKSLDIVQIETEPGKTITYCFEFGKLLFTMDNDWPVVNYNSGKLLSFTKKGKKYYVGEEELKKKNFQEASIYSSSYESRMCRATEGCFVMKKNNKYGIVDIDFKEVYPFISDNSIMEYVDGTVLLTNCVWREGDVGLCVYPITSSIYKKKVLVDNLYSVPTVYGKYVFYEGAGNDTSLIKELEKDLDVKIPESAKKIKLYTLDGKEVESIALGQNRFRLVIKEGISSWIYEDAKGNAIIKEPVELKYDNFGEKVVVIQTASSIQNGLEIFIDVATGDTAWVPECIGICSLFRYLEAGLIKVSDLPKYDFKYMPLIDYYVTTFRRDNELNLKFMRREEYDSTSRKTLYKIKNTETNKLIEKEFQLVDSFSDELLLVKFNNRWYFLNDEGEGMK